LWVLMPCTCPYLGCGSGAGICNCCHWPFSGIHPFEMAITIPTRLPHWLQETTTALADLLYPRLCAGCGSALSPTERQICPSCLAQLPRTGYSFRPTDNEIRRRFAAQVPVSHAAAGFVFEAEGRLQHIIHHLKYHYRPSLGVHLGELLAHETSADFGVGADALVPVPLHPRKQAQRGYNQSERLAVGLGRVWGTPVAARCVQRTIFTASQTGKTRPERFANMEGAFVAKAVEGKCVIVVDDVVTTGATLAAVLQALHAAGAAELRVLTLAVAS
jgi:ComF family protein